MEINPSKSKIMHIGKNNPGLPYSIDVTNIDSVTTEKDIGFWISDDLSPLTHVHKARSRALGEISRIRRNFTFIDKSLLCSLQLACQAASGPWDGGMSTKNIGGIEDTRGSSV